MKSKKSILLIMLITFSVTSIPTASSEESEVPKYGGTLVIAAPADILHFNPAITWSIASHYVSGQIFNSLLMYDWNLNPIPDLAESWEISEDGLKYTFHLVENANWHDGEPFTSADVKFTFEEAVIPYHPLGRSIHNATIKSIETPDPYTVVFNLRNPFPPYIKFFGLLWAGIIPKHLYEGTDILDNPLNYENPIGTGPFKYVEWEKGDHITLEKNENYFKEGKPYLDKIVFKIMPSAISRMVALEAGEVDYDLDVPKLEKERLEQIEGLTTQEVPTGFASPNCIRINLRNPPLDDKRVRQALNYLTDKDYLFDNVYLGVGYDCIATISKNPILAEFHNPDVNWYEYDLEKAEELLDEAGYPKGTDGKRFSLKVMYRAGHSHLEKIAEVLRSQWAEGGVDLILQPTEEVASLDAVFVRFDFELYLRWHSAGPDPIMTKGYFLSDMIGKGHFSNCMGFNNSRVDELFSLIETETNQELRREYFFEFQEIVNDELPVLYYFDAPSIQSWDSDFVGIPVGPWGAMRERQDVVWWKQGFSPATIDEAVEAIQNAEKEGRTIGLEKAKSLLQEAESEFNAGNYDSAATLAANVKTEADIAKTYWGAYGTTISIAVILVLAAIVIIYSRMKK